MLLSKGYCIGLLEVCSSKPIIQERHHNYLIKLLEKYLFFPPPVLLSLKSLLITQAREVNSFVIMKSQPFSPASNRLIKSGQSQFISIFICAIQTRVLLVRIIKCNVHSNFSRHQQCFLLEQGGMKVFV